MKYVGKIIEDVREHTGNTSYAVDATGATTSGLSQHLILSHIQDAQDHLATLVINTHARIFTATKEISMVAGQEGYSVPDNIHINNKIISVQYSFDGTAVNYTKLKPKSIRERMTNSYSFASFYIRYQDQLLINPIPSSSAAKIRVHYYRTLDRVALRAGTVTAKTEPGSCRECRKRSLRFIQTVRAAATRGRAGGARFCVTTAWKRNYPGANAIPRTTAWK